MALPPELELRLHEQHRLAQTRLADATALLLAARIARLEALGDEQLEQYVAGAVPVVVAGQTRSAALAAGYVRTLAPPTRERRPPLELELGDIAVTAETPWLASPIIRARTELSRGGTWEQSLAVAATRARGYVYGDLAVAQRFGLERGGRSAGREPSGYRKHLAPSACAWCSAVSQTVYALPSNVPFHERDRCSVSPVFD